MERIVRRHLITRDVAIAHIDVDTEDLAQQGGHVLRQIHRIIAGASITHRDVEVSIGSKVHIAAVVIGERLDDVWRAAWEEQIEATGGVGLQWIPGASEETRDDGIAAGVGEVDPEPSAHGVVGRKDQTEQSSFTARAHHAGDVEEGRR